METGRCSCPLQVEAAGSRAEDSSLAPSLARHAGLSTHLRRDAYAPCTGPVSRGQL